MKKILVTGAALFMLTQPVHAGMLDFIIAPDPLTEGMAHFQALMNEAYHNIDEQSKRLGIPFERMRVMEVEAEQAGVDSNYIFPALKFLGERMRDAAYGRSATDSRMFSALHIDLRDSDGIVDVDLVARQIGVKIAGMRDPFTQARLAGLAFGGEELLPYLRTMGAAAPVAAAPAPVADSFEQGRHDRKVYEAWIAEQQGGMIGEGALWWAAHRSIKGAACPVAEDWQEQFFPEGCRQAQKILAPFDAKRNSDPEYKRGWNSL